ncbi:MAG TPA: adenylate/guanylate cyclase domain-containing protein [Anaerolineales bacterium]|nr:adenylate/guanylate cyclase domain-containing protein [Anaerolineales bacterium]
MGSLPSGTVTFLFTDIEGSTKLSQEFPDEMPILLARHNEILSQAIQKHNGFVFQMVGDSYSAAFHNASDALNAALAAQSLLYSENWSPAPLKVRMGIHTGAAKLEENLSESRYSGYSTIALTQRIMSAGHGGQILLSQTVHDLTRDKLPEHTQLVDMGEHSFKGILRAEHLYQLTVPDLPSQFAPLNTTESINHNLPAQLTSFIGREKEISTIIKHIIANRIVTLTGSGGAGKTRLSLQVGTQCLSQFQNGVWIAELAPVADPALIPQTLLRIFNLREDVQRAPLEVLIDYLRNRSLLLILDNCEHLIETCAKTSEALLRACPKLKILASSREALEVAGEVAYRVPSLTTPDPDHLPPLEEFLEVESIRLFIERAANAKTDFKLTKDNASFIAQICFRLDGIPLAIELAAARVKMMSPEQIASRLGDRFRLLTGGSRTALPRQQTLRALIDWSYSLLSEPEKTLFRRLAVFVGGWSLEAAEAVCGEERGELDVLDPLTRLVDKSLVFVEEEFIGEMRYHRLESIRHYSREKFFDTDEVEIVRDRHLEFFLQFAELADENLQGRDQFIWVNRMLAEMDNLRTALEWGLSRKPFSALRIVGAMNILWPISGYSAEGFRWAQKALEQVENIPIPEGISKEQQLSALAKALRGLAWLYLSLGDNANAIHRGEESVALYRQSLDRRGLSLALLVLAYPLEFQGEREQAETLLLESIEIARAEGYIYGLSWSLCNLARVALDLYQDFDLARSYVEEALRHADEAGFQYQVAMSADILGIIAVHENDYDEARSRFKESLRGFQDVGATFNIILEKSSLAHLERQQRNYARALEYYRETIVAFRDVAQTGAVAHQLECFGFIAIAQDQYERALKLFAAADALREKGGTPMTPDEQVYFDKQLNDLHEKLDPTQFHSIWSRGRAMTMAQAIGFALETTHD